MLKINRHHRPVLEPSKDYPWARQTVMNPGVVYENGLFRMLFTATDGSGRYCLGYAESTDGLNFTWDEKPRFEPNPDKFAFDHGTVEDPRITTIDGIHYITYAARYTNMLSWAEGGIRLGPNGDMAASWICNNRRVGLAKTTDFHHFERMGALSSPYLNDANVVLFPEQINGKYVYLHRPTAAPAWLLPLHYEPGKTWILFTDCIDHWCSDKIAMDWEMVDGIDIPDDYMLLAPEQSWETLKTGPSGVPIATDDGWLMFYHAVDRQGTYRIGLALLDREDPRKVLCRTPNPVMEPEGELELHGGPYPGCIFPCAILPLDDDTLRFYYGICDRCIGTATVSMKEALQLVKRYPRELL